LPKSFHFITALFVLLLIFISHLVCFAFNYRNVPVPAPLVLAKDKKLYNTDTSVAERRHFVAAPARKHDAAPDIFIFYFSSNVKDTGMTINSCGSMTM
jgi:hypothetical protein